VPQAVARALQIPDSPHASTEESLRQYFQGKELLLVIDNCEHLIEPTAALVQGLLRASSGLRVLATSREPLAIPGEVSYLLEPLPILEEAVSLFLERAEAASPGFRSNPEDGPAIREILSGWTACPSPSSWRRPRSASSPPQRSPGDLTSVSAY
jgi:predicted ATPase